MVKHLKLKKKKQKHVFLGLLLGTLGVNLLRNLLASKGVIGVGEGTIKSGQEF